MISRLYFRTPANPALLRVGGHGAGAYRQLGSPWLGSLVVVAAVFRLLNLIVLKTRAKARAYQKEQEKKVK